MATVQGLTSVLLTLALMGAVPLGAQAWDPQTGATGWASLDRDGSCVFHNPTGQKLVTWTRDGGAQGELDVKRLKESPERWVLDAEGNAWVVAGSVLQRLDRNGTPRGRIDLPAGVGDLAWDARSFILAYRGEAPFLEKRDLKTGAVLWTFGAKPAQSVAPVRIRHRVAVRGDGNILLAGGTDFALKILDAAKGTLVDTVAFRLGDGTVPAVAPGEGDLGNLVWWLDRDTAFFAVAPSRLTAPLVARGLAMVRLDLRSRVLTVADTGLADGHALLGATPDAWVFEAPKGGLVFLPIPD